MSQDDSLPTIAVHSILDYLRKSRRREYPFAVCSIVNYHEFMYLCHNMMSGYVTPRVNAMINNNRHIIDDRGSAATVYAEMTAQLLADLGSDIIVPSISAGNSGPKSATITYLPGSDIFVAYTIEGAYDILRYGCMPTSVGHAYNERVRTIIQDAHKTYNLFGTMSASALPDLVNILELFCMDAVKFFQQRYPNAPELFLSYVNYNIPLFKSETRRHLTSLTGIFEIEFVLTGSQDDTSLPGTPSVILAPSVLCIHPEYAKAWGSVI